MKAIDLQIPHYTSPEVLAVTRLRPEVLQTWVNRDALGARNTGRGKRRLYSAIDTIKLAIMRRMADLQVALSTSLEIAEAAAAELEEKGSLDWNFYIILRPDVATRKDVTVKASYGRFEAFDPFTRDPLEKKLSDIVEWFTGIYRRRKKVNLAEERRNPKLRAQQHQMDERERDNLARQGVHAEPAIIFPLGEIVNGTLLQLAALDRREEV